MLANELLGPNPARHAASTPSVQPDHSSYAPSQGQLYLGGMLLDTNRSFSWEINAFRSPQISPAKCFWSHPQDATTQVAHPRPASEEQTCRLPAFHRWSRAP